MIDPVEEIYRYRKNENPNRNDPQGLNNAQIDANPTGYDSGQSQKKKENLSDLLSERNSPRSQGKASRQENQNQK